MREILRDPDNLDFRPRADATEIIDAGVDIPSETLRCGVTIPDFTSDLKVGQHPDIGAYEYGAKNYWIAGFQDVKATTPIPPNGTATAKSDADLMWLPARESDMFRIYFGKSPKKMKLIAEQDNNIVDPGPLDPTATYSWRVDCKTPKGWTKGDVWTFRAKGLPFRRGTSLPSSYVEKFEKVYDFDKDNLDQNTQGLILPWLRPKFNGDHLDIHDGAIWIEPSVDRAKEFEPIQIPNINIDLERYPFVSFAYKTTTRNAPFGFYAGFSVPGGKERGVFPEKPLAVLKPSPDDFTHVTIPLDLVVAESKNRFSSAVARNFMLQINGPADAEWIKKDGVVVISDFRVGFACLLEKVTGAAIVGQHHPVVSEGQPVLIPHDVLDIEILISGQKETYQYPAGDPLPDGWTLNLKPGANYKVVDGDIVKPAHGFSGTAHVGVTLEAHGLKSEKFDIDVAVRLSVNY